LLTGLDAVVQLSILLIGQDAVVQLSAY